MATLIIEQAGGTDREFKLGKRTIVVGRQEGVPLQLDDEEQSISRRHVQIRFDESQAAYFMLDLKSRNGVVLNGRRITSEEKLSDGDVIQVGGRTLRFQAGDSPAARGAVSVFQKVGERQKSTIFRRPTNE